MADAFLGEIRIFAGNFAPHDWAFCNGQLMPITQNTALFSILGVQYGGDGRVTFALPNLQGRAPMHQGDGPGLTTRVVGELGGSSSIALQPSEMPMHTHIPNAGAAATANSPVEAFWASTSGRTGAAAYAPGTDGTTLSPAAIAVAGNSQPHNNMQPYLGLSFIICLNGYFPGRE
jgi:microcystin-dependent protein